MDTDTFDSTGGVEMELDSDSVVSGERPEDHDNDVFFEPRFQITLGTTSMEDRSTGEQSIMWKAKGHGESSVSDDPMAAVLGVIEDVSGGEL